MYLHTLRRLWRPSLLARRRRRRRCRRRRLRLRRVSASARSFTHSVQSQLTTANQYNARIV